MCINACACSQQQQHPDDRHVPDVDRRHFLTASLATALMTALTGSVTACGTSLFSDRVTAPTTLTNGLTVTLANFPALATVGGIARVDSGGGTPIAVARTGTSTFVAVSMICTHQGSTLNIVTNGFRCPNHGATFAANGQWTGGQSAANLVTYPTVYDQAAGTLQIGTTGTGTGNTGNGGSNGSDDDSNGTDH